MHPAVTTSAAAIVLGAGAVGYAWGYERKAFRLREYDVPVLPAGAEPLRGLHLSDIHGTSGQAWKVEWVRPLADTRPDLVVDTGDNMAHVDAVPEVLRALEPLLR